MTPCKMYLVPAHNCEHDRPEPPPLPQSIKSRPSVKPKRVEKRNVKQHSHDKWIALRTKLMKIDMQEAELISRYAHFLNEVLPLPPTAPPMPPNIETFNIIETRQRSAIVHQKEPPSIGDASANTWCRKEGIIEAVMPKRSMTVLTKCVGSMNLLVHIRKWDSRRSVRYQKGRQYSYDR